mmetsp:Transcript_64782/g.200594  ORF Transcript_64782/g.200594 Transcript_64782/m.200594 type:complete len:257 (-) Transcript_64782:330-1100(-)
MARSIGKALWRSSAPWSLNRGWTSAMRCRASSTAGTSGLVGRNTRSTRPWPSARLSSADPALRESSQHSALVCILKWCSAAVASGCASIAPKSSPPTPMASPIRARLRAEETMAKSSQIILQRTQARPNMAMARKAMRRRPPPSPSPSRSSAAKRAAALGQRLRTSESCAPPGLPSASAPAVSPRCLASGGPSAGAVAGSEAQEAAAVSSPSSASTWAIRTWPPPCCRSGPPAAPETVRGEALPSSSRGRPAPACP